MRNRVGLRQVGKRVLGQLPPIAVLRIHVWHGLMLTSIARARDIISDSDDSGWVNPSGAPTAPIGWWGLYSAYHHAMVPRIFKTTNVRDGSMCFIPLPFDPKAVFGKVRARRIVAAVRAIQSKPDRKR